MIDSYTSSNSKKEIKLPTYKESSSGFTSALQFVDKTSKVDLFSNSSDASRIPRIIYP